MLTRLKQRRMFMIYMSRMCLRGVIFLAVLYTYIFNHERMLSFAQFSLFGRFTVLHVLWAVLMGGMLLHLLPRTRITMSALKSRAYTYRAPEGGYDKLRLLEYVQTMNIRAWKVLLAWLFFNAIFGALYLFRVIGQAELILLTMFYFASDLVCMMVVCPFQSLFMKNRCCVNCRIFDWAHFMMYTPMLFIPSFFSWSLFFTSLVVMLRWELTYALHPERFWRGSNTAIRCENCTDRLCLIKKPLTTALGSKQNESDL